MMAMDTDRDFVNRFGLSAGFKGVGMTDEDQDAVAFEAGLRCGDVIQEINRQPVKNIDDEKRQIK
jgi:S1-C subfamily serine protease